MYRVYVENGYLFIDPVGEGLLRSYKVENIEISPIEPPGSSYGIFHEDFNVEASIPVSKMQKQNGEAYTLEEFEEFRLTQTGSNSEPLATSPLWRTGQIVSYQDYDDGFYQSGNGVDFLTLSANNPFGNTDRFTDTLGGQVYANSIALDWSTYNGNKVLGWYLPLQGTNTWSEATTNANQLVIDSFQGWRLPNWNEFVRLMKVGSSRALNYPPFNDSSNSRFWTSTKLEGYTIQPIMIMNQYQMMGTSETSLFNWYSVRTFDISELTL